MSRLREDKLELAGWVAPGMGQAQGSSVLSSVVASIPGSTRSRNSVIGIHARVRRHLISSRARA